MSRLLYQGRVIKGFFGSSAYPTLLFLIALRIYCYKSEKQQQTWKISLLNVLFDINSNLWIIYSKISDAMRICVNWLLRSALQSRKRYEAAPNMITTKIVVHQLLWTVILKGSKVYMIASWASIYSQYSEFMDLASSEANSPSFNTWQALCRLLTIRSVQYSSEVSAHQCGSFLSEGNHCTHWLFTPRLYGATTVQIFTYLQSQLGPPKLKIVVRVQIYLISLIFRYLVDLSQVGVLWLVARLPNLCRTRSLRCVSIGYLTRYILHSSRMASTITWSQTMQIRSPLTGPYGEHLPSSIIHVFYGAIAMQEPTRKWGHPFISSLFSTASGDVVFSS